MPLGKCLALSGPHPQNEQMEPAVVFSSVVFDGMQSQNQSEPLASQPPDPWPEPSPSCPPGSPLLSEGSVSPSPQAHRSSDSTSHSPRPEDSLLWVLGAERNHLTRPAGSSRPVPSAGRLKGPFSSLWASQAPVFLPNWPSSSQKNDPFPFCSLPQPNYDVWILLTVVGTIFVVILASVLRIRCRPRRSRPVSRVGSPAEVGRCMRVERREGAGRNGEGRMCLYAREAVYI